jgi:uncharacterized repeat protein (TIGR01451 family)
MTTGSFKFLSLLVVIAAGGAVAWQVHQNIVQSQNQTAENDSSDVASDRDETLADDDAEDDLSTGVALASWDEDDHAEPKLASPSLDKFQRSPAPKSQGTPIPARKASRDDSESTAEASPDADSAGTADDPFAEDAPPRRIASVVLPEDDASTSREETDASEAEPHHDAATDPFDESSSVLLVGSKETKSDDGPSLAADAHDESASADDPFAGAAPPDFGEDDAAKKTNEAAMTSGDEAKSDDSATPIEDETPFPPRREQAPKQARSPRTPRQPATFDTDDAPSNEENPPSLPAPKLGVPTALPEEHPESDREAPAEESESRARPAPRKGKDASPANAPRLLPVPDPGDDAAATSTPRPTSPSPLPDAETTDRVRGDDLRGDGMPEHDVPKGLLQPRLTIEKIAPKQAVLGQPLVYSVVVKNTGTADAHHVTVEDRIPKGTKLEGTSPRAELVEKKLVWRLGTLKPDEQKKISIKVIPQEQGPIGSVAKVNFVAEVAAEIEVTAPQLALSVESASQVRLGEKLSLLFKVRNTGGADAQNVVLRNIIPEGLRHPAGADLEYAIGTLPAKETREVKLELVAVKNGKVVNKAVITADGGILLEEETPVEVIGEQLLLTRTGKNRLFVDKPAVFTSTVTNEGTAPATKVMVAEVVPAGLEFVSASDNGKYDPATRAVTWSVGPIGPGEERKLSTKLLPKQLGEYRATVTVTGPAGGVATVDAELKVDGFPAVSVESKSDSRLISVGELATIRITCKNQGTAAAKNVILSAELPPELRFVEARGPTSWSQQGNIITFEAMESFDAGDTASFELQVEGLAEGDTPIELQLASDHLKRPLHRDEPIRVAP